MKTNIAYNMKRVAFIIALALGVSMFQVPQPTYAEAKLKDGDYVQFGLYEGKPLVWRVIGFNSNQLPLLFLTSTLKEKAFDAVHQELNDSGDNAWERSDLRIWLNSADSAGKVAYSNPPTVDKVSPPTSAYDQEAGFLSDRNFSKYERYMIEDTPHRVVLTEKEKHSSDGGTAKYETTVFQGEFLKIKDAEKNYNQAFSVGVTDKMFLLNIPQIKSVTEKYGDFYKGYNRNGELADYWLITPDGSFSDMGITVFTSAKVYKIDDTDPLINFNLVRRGKGIRPAFYLNFLKADIKNGDGSMQNPYKIVSPVTLLPNVAQAVTTTSKVFVNGKQVEFKAYNVNGNNYFKLRDLAMALGGTEKKFQVEWVGALNAINLTSGKDYTPVGGELETGKFERTSGTKSNADIYQDGRYIGVAAYNINSNNYFKLRDLGEVFNFGVSFSNDGSGGVITIDTSKSYY